MNERISSDNQSSSKAPLNSLKAIYQNVTVVINSVKDITAER